MSKTKKIKNPKISTDWTPIALGLILAAAGVALIFLREYITYIGIAVGALVCTGAIVLATLTFTGKRSGAAFVFKIIFSVCSLATGVVTIVCNAGATMIICLIFAGAIAIDGAIKFGNSIQARKYTVYGRTVSLILALVTAVSAMFVIRFINKDEIVDFSIALGVCFILDGLCNIIIPFLKSRINSAISKDLVEKTREVVAEEQRLEEERIANEEATVTEDEKVEESEEAEEFEAAEEEMAEFEETESPEETSDEAAEQTLEEEAEGNSENVEALNDEETADTEVETEEGEDEAETPPEAVEETDADGEEADKEE